MFLTLLLPYVKMFSGFKTSLNDISSYFLSSIALLPSDESTMPSKHSIVFISESHISILKVLFALSAEIKAQKYSALVLFT